MDVVAGVRCRRNRQGTRPPKAPAPSFALPLEPRLMFDGAMAATDGDGPAQNGAAPNPAETSSDPAEGASKHETRSEKQTIVFVAGSIEGLDALEKALPASAEAIILSPDGDGVRQIAEHLDGRVGLRSIHVITHGSAGEVSLGNVTLSRDTLDDHRADLASWGNTLADGGDILFYGCNVGEGESGRDFVASLAEATGVDVAASDDDTGNGTAADWALEVASGPIDAENLFRDSAPDGRAGSPNLDGAQQPDLRSEHGQGRSPDHRNRGRIQRSRRNALQRSAIAGSQHRRQPELPGKLVDRYRRDRHLDYRRYRYRKRV